MTYYQRRAMADPEFRARVAAKNAERYRRAKDADPDAWRAKQNAYWTTRYRTDEDFREKMKQYSSDRRAKQRALKEVYNASK
jgi:hypothetical protein